MPWGPNPPWSAGPALPIRCPGPGVGCGRSPTAWGRGPARPGYSPPDPLCRRTARRRSPSGRRGRSRRTPPGSSISDCAGRRSPALRSWRSHTAHTPGPSGTPPCRDTCPPGRRPPADPRSPAGQKGAYPPLPSTHSRRDAPASGPRQRKGFSATPPASDGAGRKSNPGRDSGTWPSGRPPRRLPSEPWCAPGRSPRALRHRRTAFPGRGG